MDDIIYQEPIYSKEKVYVYKGIMKADNMPVCVKFLYSDSLEEANFFLLEANNIYRFKDSGMAIVKIFDSKIFNHNSQYCVRVVMEYFKQGDLAKLIKKRSNRPWSEKELFDYLKQLITIFAYLQNIGVAHRDIKPENILISDDFSSLIVGDLGSARERRRNSSQTIAGTPMYLSPELRQEYANLISGYPRGIEYDSYKSDVYSLGLTFLYMASLHDCSDLLSSAGLREKTIARVNKLKTTYPSFHQILLWMLKYDQKERPDFNDLAKYLTTESKPTNFPSENRPTACCVHCDRVSESFFSFFEKPICSICIEDSRHSFWTNIFQ